MSSDEGGLLKARAPNPIASVPMGSVPPVTLARQRSRRMTPALMPRPRTPSIVESVRSEQSVEISTPGLGGALKRTSRADKIMLGVLCMNELLCSMSLSIMAPFFPKEASAKNVSLVVSGWVFGVFALVQCIMSPIFGKMLPKTGARFMALSGQFLAAGCTILYGMLQYIDTKPNGPMVFIIYCFVLRIFQAFGVAAYNTAAFAIAAQTFDENPATVFGVMETAVGFGLMVGPAVGGVLYEVGGFVLPFVTIGGLMIIIVPFFICVMPSDRPGAYESAPGSLSKLLKIPGVVVTCFAVVVIAIAWVVLDPTLEPHLRQFGLSPSLVGLMFLLTSACYAVCAPIWGWLADNIVNSAPMLMIGFFFTGVGLMIIGPSPLLYIPTDYKELWLNIVALIIFGVAAALGTVPTYDKILDCAEKAGLEDTFGHYSVVAGLWNSMFSFGEFVGPVFAGWSVSVIGFPWTMSATAFLCFLTSIVMGILYIYERKTNFDKVKPKEVDDEGVFDDNLNADERTPLLLNNPSDQNYYSDSGAIEGARTDSSVYDSPNAVTRTCVDSGCHDDPHGNSPTNILVGGGGFRGYGTRNHDDIEDNMDTSDAHHNGNLIDVTRSNGCHGNHIHHDDTDVGRTGESIPICTGASNPNLKNSCVDIIIHSVDDGRTTNAVIEPVSNVSA